MKPIYILAAFLLFVAFSSCQKEIELETTSSYEIVIGNETRRDLVSLEALSDGGFLVGMHTRATGTQQIELRKYNSDPQLIWSKLLGNQFENKLFHLFEDRNGNILVSAVSNSYGQEDYSLSLHKTWFPFFTLLDASANVLWETFQSEYTDAGVSAAGGSV